MSYEYTLSNLVVPTGDPVLTIDFASAISTDELDVLYTNSMFPSNIPGGTLDSTTLNNISSILSDSASGQEFKFDLSSLTLSQLNDLQIAVFILTDTVNSSPDTNPNDIPTFSASFGPSSVATPEPSSAALIVIALAGLAFLLVRRSAA